MKWNELKTQAQWKEKLQHELRTNDASLMRAVVQIYNLQTSDEKHHKETFEHNGVGFTGPDAKIMTIIAQAVIYKDGLTLSQIDTARARMPKYWKQLMIISKRNLEGQEKLKVYPSKLQDELYKKGKSIPDNVIVDRNINQVQMEMDLPV